MKFKQVIFSGIFWRGLYFATVLLLNIIVARRFGARGSGWIYYVTNYFSLIILMGSCSLESGMTYLGSQKRITNNKLASFSILWSLGISLFIVVLFSVYHSGSEQEITHSQFLVLTAVYTMGVLLTSFFSALFYAQQEYRLPNALLAVTNTLLAFTAFFTVDMREGQLADSIFFQLYFLNFLLQGLLLAAAYLKKNRLHLSWLLPLKEELKQLFRFSLYALVNNLLFFMIYRIDYWFVKNVCTNCGGGDLGNYIQVSKTAQMFLLLPVIIASAVFPLTASGGNNGVNTGLPVLARAIMLLYAIVLSVLVITGSWLFPWVYGASFNNMYFPFILLIPGILSLSTIALLTAYNAGKDRMNVNMRGSVIGLLVIFTGDWLLIPKFGIAGAALVSSAGYISYLAYLLHCFKKEYQIPVSHFFIPVRADWRRLQQILSVS